MNRKIRSSNEIDMKCYLHIGTEKTATKTIQSFLHLNREKLLKYGTIFTKSAGTHNNIKLPLAAYNLTRRDELTRIYGINSPKTRQTNRQKLIRKLKNEINNLHGESVLFSSEHIQSRLITLKEIRRLKSILNELGIEDITIIIYLRKPADLANSLYSTAVKYGSLDDSPPPPSQKYFQNICNHRRTLRKFQSVFRNSTIIPRLFIFNELKGGSILTDFCETCGLPWQTDFIIPENQNESLSILGIEILRRINKQLPYIINVKLNKQRLKNLHYIQENYSVQKYIMPENICQQYISVFQNSNQWVRKTYFPDRNSLFPLTNIPEEIRTDLPSEKNDEIANELITRGDG